LHLEFIALEGMNNTISPLPLGTSAIFPGALQSSPTYLLFKISPVLASQAYTASVLKWRFQFILGFTKAV